MLWYIKFVHWKSEQNETYLFTLIKHKLTAINQKANFVIYYNRDSCQKNSLFVKIAAKYANLKINGGSLHPNHTIDKITKTNSHLKKASSPSTNATSIIVI